MSSCYWASQGQCLLTKLPCESVLEILHTVPNARHDLLNCALNCAQNVNPLYLEYVNQVGLIQDPSDQSALFQKKIGNKFVDNHRNMPDMRLPKKNS
jgi:hypothetical protein